VLTGGRCAPYETSGPLLLATGIGKLPENTLLESRSDRWLFAKGRLRHGVTPERAQAGMNVLASQLARAYPESNRRLTFRVMSEHLGFMLFAPRLAGILLAVFGGLAMLLAITGLYGVVAFAASQRTREVGIRVALGASSADVVTLVMRQSVALVASGAAIGLVIAFLATRPLGSFLYGIGPLDLLTFVGMTLLLAAVALAASFVPALRTARVDPMTALRCK
jgi:ABC-type antimicrobial peptide transport system permease subunit